MAVNKYLKPLHKDSGSTRSCMNLVCDGLNSPSGDDMLTNLRALARDAVRAQVLQSLRKPGQMNLFETKLVDVFASVC